MVKTTEAKSQVRRVGRPKVEVPGAIDTPATIAAPDDKRDAMNAMALRIWEGQSIDLPRAERVRRIEAGLTAQGYTDFDNLSLPYAA